MMLQLGQRLAVLFVGLGLCSLSASAQTILAPAPKVPPAQQQAVPKVQPVQAAAVGVAKADLARNDRRRSKSPGKNEPIMSEKKKTKRFAYSYLLPFGVGQFEQDKTVLGTVLATSQAGFLLMYFDRLNAVRSSNADAADVMGGADMSKAASDRATLNFLDQNEAFTLRAQQQANMALVGFFALYTLGVVDAVFDPLSRLNLGGLGFGKKKKVSKEREDPFAAEGSTRLVDDLKQEQTDTKVGVFYQPAPGSASAVGVSVQKPF